MKLFEAITHILLWEAMIYAETLDKNNLDADNDKVHEVINNLFGKVYSKEEQHFENDENLHRTSWFNGEINYPYYNSSLEKRLLFCDIERGKSLQNSTHNDALYKRKVRSRKVRSRKVRSVYNNIKGKYSQRQEKKANKARKEAAKLPQKIPLDLIRDNQLKVMLQRIGVYLRGHKYLEIDHRFHSEDKKKRGERAPLKLIEKVFMRHFPIPRLRRLQPTLEVSCNQGFIHCVREIYWVVEQTPVFNYLKSGSWSFLKSYLKSLLFDRDEARRQLSLAPFETPLDQFRFRTTASYYMCYYTMQELPTLKYFGQKCDMVGWSLKGAWSIRQMDTKDYRTNDKYPFGCALLSFCPNYCCGRVPGGQPRNIWQCQNHVSNPCHKLPDKTCQPDFTNNYSFQDLIKNRVNITCKCETFHKGFQWSMKFNQCVDKDECYDRTFHCPDHNHICRNTVGGYECSCKRGYTTATPDTCKRIPEVETYDLANASYMGMFTDAPTTQDTLIMMEQKAEAILETVANALSFESTAARPGSTISLTIITIYIAKTFSV